MQSLLYGRPPRAGRRALPDGGLFRSCADQGPHFRGSLIDATAACLTPSSLTQAQTDIGPNHVFTRQTAQSALPSASRSASGSSQGSGPGYSHLGPASQSVPFAGPRRH